MSEGSDSDMIEALREELREAPIRHPFRTELLRALGDTLFNRHLQTESMDDLDEAIDLGRQVVASVTEPQERAEALIHLGIRLGERYSTTGEQADFDEAQRILHQAHNLSDDAEQGESWYNLGLLYKFRYGKTRDPADLDEAIRFFRLPADVTPPHHPLWAACLNNLGNALEARYMISNKQEDLSEAIELARKVLKTVSDDHPTYPKVLVNLGNRLNLEYSRTAVAEPLDEAIQLFTQALHVIPDEEPHRAYVLSILGQCLGQRALTHDGTVADLDEGIRLCREAVDITADENPEKVAYLNNLGNLLGDIYLFKTGAVADLNDSIQCLRQAVNTEPQDNDEMVICCSNLAAQLNERYSRTGALADLEEAIELQRKVVKNTSKTHANYVLYLTNLGIFLSNLHSRTKKSHVLEEAISVIEQACDGTPENGSARIAQLNQLAILRGRKYADTRKMSDLEAAIQAGRDAVAAAPRGHPSLGTVFNNLGDDLGNLYLRTRDITRLEEGLACLQQAFEILPAESPDRSALLGNLGDQLMHRYKAKSAVEDRRRALDYYQEALRLESASLLSRIYAGRAILDAIIDTRNQDTASADPAEWELAYEAANVAVNLIPRLSSRSLRNADRKHALSQNQVVGLASDAAAVALQTGKSPLEALRLLEQGRGVLGASLEQMRAEIQSLRAVDPDLADRFVRLREELDDAGETSQLQRPLDVEDQGVQGPKTSSPRALTTRRSEASKEFDELLARIQGLPGFEDFLRPLGEEDIREAARYGPVVVVNVSRFRCDALLVDTAQVRAVPLVGLSKEDIQNRAKQDDKLRSYQTLEWLWDVVAKPVLDALGYAQPVPAAGDDSDTALPHIWWIPTGPLTKLPLHAAGYHDTRSGTTVLDRVS
jgi:tetratricopeptide (TPR) repeat protein